MRLSGEFGRFTACGDDEVEARIGNTIREARDALRSALRPERVRSVVLLGSYGRSEGGIEWRADGAHPHNNFDLLIIARDGDLGALKTAADRALAPIAARAGVPFDVGVISESALERSQSLLMWYDMRFGHKLILGDPAFVQGLHHLCKERIPSWDVRNLLVNRGTLLLINALVLDRGQLCEADRRTVTRHGMKAIIGCGDAWLFFAGRYEPSYRTRRTRMQESVDAPPRLRSRYEEAMSFRFAADYARFGPAEPSAWNTDLLELFREVHLAVERARLDRPELTWGDYPRVAYGEALATLVASPKRLARGAGALFRRPWGLQELGFRGQVGFWTATPREHLPLLFPAAAYRRMPQHYAGLAAEVLRPTATTPQALWRAYLEAWGRFGDTNFLSVAPRLRIGVG